MRGKKIKEGILVYIFMLLFVIAGIYFLGFFENNFPVLFNTGVEWFNIIGSIFTSIISGFYISFFIIFVYHWGGQEAEKLIKSNNNFSLLSLAVTFLSYSIPFIFIIILFEILRGIDNLFWVHESGLSFMLFILALALGVFLAAADRERSIIRKLNTNKD
ncbi:MAG: hypothetical protein ABEJ24_01895 [Candidatus Magasanikbacteria bacterium]